MSYRYAIIGAGRQGIALAYDLLKSCAAEEVRLLDNSSDIAARAVERAGRMIPQRASALHAGTFDAAAPQQHINTLRGCHVVISAAPYRYNIALTDAAIEARAAFCDLGGNTAVVVAQLARHTRAATAGVSVIPDCGLAPGLGNILASHGVSMLDEPMDVHVRCGGLPQRPVGPLGYKLVFNFEGLINEYSGNGEFLRDGRRIEVPALTELEAIDFPDSIGRCEAAVTSGGTSTCSETYSGRLRTYDYKTVRYPGHFAIIRAMFELGFMSREVIQQDGGAVVPIALTRRLFEQRLDFPDVRDLVVLRTTVSGRRAGRATTLQFDLFDRHDETTGLTAMERTTAFPTALVAFMQARGDIAPGARPLEACIPTQDYFKELPHHDLQIKLTET